jgi:glycosyltransferase involved in cell wall biosynthesis
MDLDEEYTMEVQEVLPLSIVVPAYNEESGLGGVLHDLCKLKLENDFEIIVVDDGSEDRTAEIVRQFSDVRLIKHAQNQGYGASLKSGIRQARGSAICIIDADGTYASDCIPVLLEYMTKNNCDMIVAARTGERVAIPLIRRPAKWFITRLASYVAGTDIPDLNSGLRVFPRDTALSFFGILPNGFSFTTTITLGMLTNGYSVEYLPVDYHPRVGHSKIRPIQDTVNFIQLISRIALYFQPLKVFVPLSVGLFMAAVFWAIVSKVVLGQLADVSVLVMVMTAIQVYTIGMLAELINHRVPSAHCKETDP